MAAVGTISVSPTQPVSGATAIVGVSFSTLGGIPGWTAGLSITRDGQVVATQSVQFASVPAEAVPSLSVGATGKGWEIQTDVDVLVPASLANVFFLHP